MQSNCGKLIEINDLFIRKFGEIIFNVKVNWVRFTLNTILVMQFCSKGQVDVLSGNH